MFIGIRKPSNGLHGARRIAEWLRKAGSTRPTHNGQSASLRRMYRGSHNDGGYSASEAQLTVAHYKLI